MCVFLLLYNNLKTSCTAYYKLQWRCMMYKPFIKLFRTPNRKYFYEPNKNEFITISDESYDFLQAVFNDDDSLTMPKEIQELMDEGYLAEKSVVEKVEHPYTKYIDSVMQRKIHKITLQVTQNL